MAVNVGTLLVAGIVIVVIYVAVLWIALAFYVVRDARRRTTSPGFTLFAMLVGFIPPFLGALIYFMARPPMTMEQVRSLAIEEQVLLEPPPEGVPTRPCPTCGREIEQEFILCPYCRTQFARRCTGCDRSLRLGWEVCPYCATEVGAPALTRAGR
jgi:RNA polymerase subunit RPABC4/transcription elongation factor Spt4